jgi:hypothetical protein
MTEKCAITKGIFGRFYLAHPDDSTLGWTGSRWSPQGGDFELCNFESTLAAAIYAAGHGLEPVKSPIEIAADDFYAHLDVCRQCEGHPFQLCEVGRPLLLAVGVAQGIPSEDRTVTPEVADIMQRAIREIVRRRDAAKGEAGGR